VHRPPPNPACVLGFLEALFSPLNARRDARCKARLSSPPSPLSSPLSAAGDSILESIARLNGACSLWSRMGVGFWRESYGVYIT